MTEVEQANLTKQPGVSSLDHTKGPGTESERRAMIRRPIRVLALVLLLCMVAVQVHVCIERSVAQRSQHQCQLCKTGGWAEPATEMNLDARLASNPLQEVSATQDARPQPIEASSSRAPPLS